jgi:hypothetical protein
MYQEEIQRIKDLFPDLSKIDCIYLSLCYDHLNITSHQLFRE